MGFSLRMGFEKKIDSSGEMLAEEANSARWSGLFNYFLLCRILGGGGR